MNICCAMLLNLFGMHKLDRLPDLLLSRFTRIGKRTLLLLFMLLHTKYVSLLEALLAGVSLSATSDLRLCPWEDMAHKLNSSTVYQAVVTNGQGCEYYKFIWENSALLKLSSLAGYWFKTGFKPRKIFSKNTAWRMMSVNFACRPWRAQCIWFLVALLLLASGRD
jgi:hypothetical protein